MYIHTFLLRMADTVTSQNIDLSSWGILYTHKYAPAKHSRYAQYKYNYKWQCSYSWTRNYERERGWGCFLSFGIRWTWRASFTLRLRCQLFRKLSWIEPVSSKSKPFTLWLSFVNWPVYFFPLWRYSPILGLGLPPWNFPFHFDLLDLRQSVGLLWAGDQLLARPLYTNTEKNTHTLILNIHALSGIRTHDHGFRASEDNICLRLLDYRDRRAVYKLDEYQYSVSIFNRPKQRRKETILKRSVLWYTNAM
jgi:hypothetical protein